MDTTINMWVIVCRHSRGMEGLSICVIPHVSSYLTCYMFLVGLRQTVSVWRPISRHVGWRFWDGRTCYSLHNHDNTHLWMVVYVLHKNGRLEHLSNTSRISKHDRIALLMYLNLYVWESFWEQIEGSSRYDQAFYSLMDTTIGVWVRP